MKIYYKINKNIEFIKQNPELKSLFNVEGEFFLLIKNEFYFPSKQWIDYPILIAEIWLDSLLEYHLRKTNICVLEFYDDAYEIQIHKGNHQCTFSFSHRGRNLNIPTLTWDYEEFLLEVIIWLNKLLEDIELLGGIFIDDKYDNLINKISQLKKIASNNSI